MLWPSLSVVLAASLGAVFRDLRLPAPTSLGAPAALFSEGRVLSTVEALTAHGPRPAGSDAEALAFEHAASSFKAAASLAKLTGMVGVGVVRSSTSSGAVRYGAASANLSDTAAVSEASYAGLDLLLARFVPVGWSERTAANGSAILIAAHVDTVWTSPGAADNSVNVATLLEVARVLASGTAAATPSPVFFLLSSAEEEGMLGAHAFLSHPWSRFVGAVVNLEAMGSGGRAIVFQATRGSSWLLDALRAQPAPVDASSVANDIFDAGLVKSDTDVRMFRKKYPCLDVAFVGNGAVYHTSLDDAPLLRASPGAIQQLGDSLVALLRSAAVPPPRRNATAVSSDAPLPAFFPVAGRLATHARLTGAQAGALLACGVALSVRRDGPLGPFLAVAVLFSWSLSVVGAAAFSVYVSALGAPPLFAHARGALFHAAVTLPAALLLPLVAQALLAAAVSSLQSRAARRAAPLPDPSSTASFRTDGEAEEDAAKPGLSGAEDALRRASMLAWAALAFFASSAGLGCVYIPLAFTAFPGVASLSLPLPKGAPRGTTARAFFLAPPAALLASLASTLLPVLAGVASRSGGSHATPLGLETNPFFPPDALVSCATAAFAALAFSYALPLVAARPKAAAFAAATLLAASLGLGAGVACRFRPNGAALHPSRRGYDALHPRPILLTHVHFLTPPKAPHLFSGALPPSDGGDGAAAPHVSFLLLASPAPGLLQSLADAMSASFVGSAGARGRGATLTSDCAAAPKADASLYLDLVTTRVASGCVLHLASGSLGGQALVEAKGRTPSLLLDAEWAAPGKCAADASTGFSQPFLCGSPSVQRVHFDPGVSTRWALSFNPRRVARFTIASGRAEGAAPADAPLGWGDVAVDAPFWPVARHAGGGGAGKAPVGATVFVQLRGNSTLGVAVRARADSLAETPGFAAARAAVPPDATLFAKASLPQALAFLMELEL